MSACAGAIRSPPASPPATPTAEPASAPHPHPQAVFDNECTPRGPHRASPGPAPAAPASAARPRAPVGRPAFSRSSACGDAASAPLHCPSMAAGSSSAKSSHVASGGRPPRPQAGPRADVGRRSPARVRRFVGLASPATWPNQDTTTPACRIRPSLDPEAPSRRGYSPERLLFRCDFREVIGGYDGHSRGHRSQPTPQGKGAHPGEDRRARQLPGGVGEHALRLRNLGVRADAPRRDPPEP